MLGSDYLVMYDVVKPPQMLTDSLSDVWDLKSTQRISAFQTEPCGPIRETSADGAAR